MISKAEAQKKAEQVICTPGKDSRIGSFRDVKNGWVFFPEPRASFQGQNAYYPPAIIVRADGKMIQTDGATPLEHDLQMIGMSIA